MPMFFVKRKCNFPELFLKFMFGSVRASIFLLEEFLVNKFRLRPRTLANRGGIFNAQRMFRITAQSGVQMFGPDRVRHSHMRATAL